MFESNLLKIKEVQDLLGIGNTAIYLKMNKKYKEYYDETFPLPIKIGKRQNRWIRSEIEQWLANKADARSQVKE